VAEEGEGAAEENKGVAEEGREGGPETKAAVMLLSLRQAPAESEALLQRHEILDQFGLSRDDILLCGKLHALCVEQVDEARHARDMTLPHQLR
jgi:hypothetical protein